MGNIKKGLCNIIRNILFYVDVITKWLFGGIDNVTNKEQRSLLFCVITVLNFLMFIFDLITLKLVGTVVLYKKCIIYTSLFIISTITVYICVYLLMVAIFNIFKRIDNKE